MSTERRSITSDEEDHRATVIAALSDLEKSTGSQEKPSNGAVEGDGGIADGCEEDGIEVKVRAVLFIIFITAQTHNSFALSQGGGSPSPISHQTEFSILFPCNGSIKFMTRFDVLSFLSIIATGIFGLPYTFHITVFFLQIDFSRTARCPWYSNEPRTVPLDSLQGVLNPL